ncbi:MAG: cytidylate kinase family protein, partial [Deltaproteobacteria bacterium]|nr:cytidylate kinase family protein [Deltaproteobacteria bacterium]
TTAYLCKRALEGGMVYHGRSAHLLFPGIMHVLKVRVIEDETSKINDVMQQLRVDRTKAQRYVTEVERDRERWVRSLYGVSWADDTYYDVVFNLGHMSVENAAAALANIAQLPDFQITPSSKRAMENLMLASEARVLLARDERTFRANIKVRADGNVITVTYLPQDAGLAEIIPEVLAPLEDIREIRTTMATTNILWIQEAFDPASETFNQVVEIATKWNAAVELLQFFAENPEKPEEIEGAGQTPASLSASFSRECIGGIEEDDTDVACDDKGLKAAHEALARLGRSGGGRTVCGGGEQIIKSIDRTVPYSLVVVGNICLDKGHAARLRMVRQLQSYLNEHIKAPVVNAEELKTQYLFSKRDITRMLGYLGLVVFIVFLVFSNQQWVLKFLSGVEWKSRVLAAIAVFLFVPTIAYLYSNVTKSIMKLIRME